MEIKKNDIEFKYDFNTIEGINSDIFPPNFLCTIIGKPGSGKTTLLRQLLLNPDLLYKKFDHVIIASPSIEEFPFVINPDNMTNKFNIQWFYNRLKVIKEQNGNILIIIDDFISQIKKQQLDPMLMALIYNRRHLVKNSTISIIITSQRYMTIPPIIRSCITVVILFQLTRRDMEKIWDEHINLSKKNFFRLVSFDSKNSFALCNLNDNKFFLNFDQVFFSQS